MRSLTPNSSQVNPQCFLCFFYWQQHATAEPNANIQHTVKHILICIITLRKYGNHRQCQSLATLQKLEKQDTIWSLDVNISAPVGDNHSLMSDGSPTQTLACHNVFHSSGWHCAIKHCSTLPGQVQWLLHKILDIVIHCCRWNELLRVLTTLSSNIKFQQPTWIIVWMRGSVDE